MRDFYDDDDATVNLFELRWFAASAKVKRLQDEYEVMRDVVAQAAGAYRSARRELARLEVLCDNLAQQPVTPVTVGRFELGAGRPELSDSRQELREIRSERSAA